MEHTHSHVAAASDVDFLSLVLRVVLLTSTALVAGIGLLRSSVAASSRLAWAAALVAAVASASSATVLDINIGFAVVHAVLALAVPISLRWRAAATYLGFALALLLIAEAAAAFAEAPRQDGVAIVDEPDTSELNNKWTFAPLGVPIFELIDSVSGVPKRLGLI
ncbi:DUF6239 family natural product biosynthesis protein [Saccharopolyspora sp. NPDC002376]